MKVRACIVAAASALIALSGCSKTPPRELPLAPGEQAVEQVMPGSHADFLAQTAGANIIYFDTDRFNIDAEDAAALQVQARWLQKYPNKTATIEGHCDERGTREYNLGLGERRANAAKNYLASLGVDPDQLVTVSYGKEQPASLGSDEMSWAKNRRAVTIIIN